MCQLDDDALERLAQLGHLRKEEDGSFTSVPLGISVMVYALDHPSSGCGGDEIEPTDEELLARMRDGSKGFAEMCRRFEESVMKRIDEDG